jgi:hypothetical protein
MAKVIAPLFSVRASGTLANTITYVCGHLARYAGKKSEKGGQPPTAQNDKFSEAVALWQSFTDEQKQAWHDFAKLVHDKRVCTNYEYYLNDYQLFMSYYLSYGEDGWENYPNPGSPPVIL